MMRGWGFPARIGPNFSPTLGRGLVRIEPLRGSPRGGPLRDAAAGGPGAGCRDGRQQADAASFHDWMADALDRAAAGLDGPFCILSTGADKPLGSTRYLAHSAPEHKGLGGALDAPGLRPGGGAEAEFLLLGHAFKRLGCSPSRGFKPTP